MGRVLAAAIAAFAAWCAFAPALAESFDYTGALQSYVVPESGLYSITAFGAQGGAGFDPSRPAPFVPGLGAEVGGLVQLSAGDVLTILVGGQGAGSGTGSSNFQFPCCITKMVWGGSGGGGSFIILNGTDPLIVAGGGGGGGNLVYFNVSPTGPNGGDGLLPVGGAGTGIAEFVAAGGAGQVVSCCAPQGDPIPAGGFGGGQASLAETGPGPQVAEAAPGAAMASGPTAVPLAARAACHSSPISSKRSSQPRVKTSAMAEWLSPSCLSRRLGG